jgi:hypothetical protein
LHVGSVAELVAGTHRRQQIAEQVAAVASDKGVYSGELHEAYLRQSQPDSTDRQIASSVRSAQSRLAFVAGLESSGVRVLDNEHYAVDAEVFRQFSQRGSERTDVRVIAERTLSDQIEAHAVTWLDRQAFVDHQDARTADHPAVQEAIGKRQDWLVANGYAQQAKVEDGMVELRTDTLRELATEEWTAVSQRLAKKYGMAVSQLPQGGSVDGNYEGVEHLHAGKMAVVVSDDGVFVSPVRQTPDAVEGSSVTLQRTSAQDTTVELAATQTLELDAGLSLDGPGDD